MLRRLCAPAAALPLALLLCAPGAGSAIVVAATDPATCFGALPNQLPDPKPGDLRFGINPRAEVGQVGATASALPEKGAAQAAAVQDLAGNRQFVVRLTRLMWPVTDATQAQRLDGDIALYAAAGAAVELQLRYHPATGAADPAAFAQWAGQVVHAYSGNPSVVAVQVTNEANASYSSDSSDGAYPQATQALIAGVERASQQARADGGRIKVGWNWFYRSDPTTERNFWTTLQAQGGDALVRATDWVGLDAYPGTFFPPTESGSGAFYNGMANALSTLRCLMPAAGYSNATPVYIEETGYPTDAASRTPDIQVQALQEMSKAAHDYAAYYNVTDFRWFDLRDADSASPSFQQHYGLMGSDYSRKPAYAAFAQAVAQFGRANVAPPPGTPTPRPQPSAAAVTPAPLYTVPASGAAGLPALATGDAGAPGATFNEGAGGVLGAGAAAQPSDRPMEGPGPEELAPTDAEATSRLPEPAVPPLAIVHRVLRIDPRGVAVGLGFLLIGLLLLAAGVLFALARRPDPAGTDASSSAVSEGAPPAGPEVSPAPVIAVDVPAVPPLQVAAVAVSTAAPRRRAAPPAGATPRTRRQPARGRAAATRPRRPAAPRKPAG